MIPLILGLLPLAAAQELAPPEVPEAPKTPALPTVAGASGELKAPMVLVLGFEDRVADGDCDRWVARYGGCVELVDLLDADALWSGEATRTRARAEAVRDLSRLFVSTWQGVAWQWGEADAAPTIALGGAGLTGPPTLASTYDPFSPDPGHRIALPDRNGWLTAAEVGTVPDPAVAPLFSAVRWVGLDGSPPLPPTSVLRGRFASRLGFDGRRHDFEVMDADPASSAPFFEQMYPYARAMSGSDARERPLAEFARTTSAPLPSFGSPEAFERDVSARFRTFSDLLNLQLLRFSVSDVTVNHMRVLAALTAMESPPLLNGRRSGITRNLVAASRGQTDRPDEVEGKLDVGLGRARLVESIRYDVLPDEVVQAWTRRELTGAPMDAAWRAPWHASLVEFFGTLLRPGEPPPADATDAGIEAWVRRALDPGIEPGDAQRQARWLALRAWVGVQPPEAKARAESWLLLDHVNYAVSGTFDTTPGVLATPADRVDASSNQWKAVLVQHGFAPRAVAQGLGAVDPTAICTTRDGLAALEEPSVGAITVEQLVVAPDGLTTAADILWSARDHLPFLALDDPHATAPGVQRVVGLPGARALYRVKWSLWSGWHILWTTHQGPSGPDTVAARSAALCSDLVLTPTDLVPTLLRASLLEGGLFPTTVVTAADRRAHPEGPPTVTPAADPAAPAPMLPAALSDLAAEAVPMETTPTPNAPLGPDAATLDWLRSLMRAPLRRLATDAGGGVLLVADLSTPGRTSALADLTAHTPYRRAQSAIGRGLSVRSAVWGWHLPGKPDVPDTLVAPAWRPTASVSSNVERPAWSRPSPVDFWLDVGIDGTPRREVVARCQVGAQTALVANPCAGDSTYVAEGMGVDVTALTTWWHGDHARTGLDLGLFGTLDVLHDRYAFIAGQATDIPRTWTFRPTFGLTAGARWLFAPGPLFTGQRGWPWGADRQDGSSRSGRTALGVRGSFGLGPGFNGLEATTGLDAWLGVSAWRGRRVVAAFQPYRPSLLIGPYVHGEVGFLLGDATEDRAEELRHTWSVSAGLKGQLRLAAAAPKPEAPKAPEAPEAPTLP